MCLDVVNSREMSVLQKHYTARINLLDVRRDVQLRNIMYILKNAVTNSRKLELLLLAKLYIMIFIRNYPIVRGLVTI